MSDNPFPSAAELRAKLDTAQNVAAQTQIQSLLTKIKTASEQGKSSITLSQFEPGVKTLLEQRGYRVVFTPGYDQRDHPYYTVSW
jgi:hypothetical protein